MKPPPLLGSYLFLSAATWSVVCSIAATAFIVIPTALDRRFDYGVLAFAGFMGGGILIGFIWGLAFGFVAAGVSRLLRIAVPWLWIRVTLVAAVMVGGTIAAYVFSFSQIRPLEVLVIVIGVVPSVLLAEIATRHHPLGWSRR